MNKITFDFTGKVALLTGAARGIGLAMAQALAAHGCAVAIQDIDEQVAREEADKINQQGGRAIGLGGDNQELAIRIPKPFQQLHVELLRRNRDINQ